MPKHRVRIAHPDACIRHDTAAIQNDTESASNAFSKLAYPGAGIKELVGSGPKKREVMHSGRDHRACAEV